MKSITADFKKIFLCCSYILGSKEILSINSVITLMFNDGTLWDVRFHSLSCGGGIFPKHLKSSDSVASIVSMVMFMKPSTVEDDTKNSRVAKFRLSCGVEFDVLWVDVMMFCEIGPDGFLG